MGRRRMEAEVDRMLEIKDLHVHYGVIPALKGISLHIEEGEVVSMTPTAQAKPPPCIPFPA